MSLSERVSPGRHFSGAITFRVPGRYVRYFAVRFGWRLVFVAVSVVAVAGAIVAHRTGVRPPYWVGSAAGFVTISAGAVWVIGLLARAMPLSRALAGGLGVMAFTTAIEVASLATGFPCGRYRYTELWQPGFHTVEAVGWFPVALPMAWFVLTGATTILVRSRFGGWPCLVASGFALALVDAVLEPVMIGPVGFWRWDEVGPLLGAPWSNFGGWFVAGFVGAAILGPFRPDARTTAEASLLLIVVLAGSVVIGVGHGTVVAMWGLAPLAVLLAGHRRIGVREPETTPSSVR